MTYFILWGNILVTAVTIDVEMEYIDIEQNIMYRPTASSIAYNV